MKPAVFRWNALITACLLIGLVTNVIVSEAKTNITAVSPPAITVLLNDQELSLETEPLIQNGTTLVPMKTLFQALDMTLEWDATSKTVRGTKDNLWISLTIGSKEALINDSGYELTEPAMLQDSFTLVPLRFISEATDALVLWQPYLRQVYIYEAEFLEQIQLSKAQLTDNFNQYLADSLAEYEQQKERWTQEQAENKEKNKESDDETQPNPSLCSVWRYHPMYGSSLEWVPCP